MANETWNYFYSIATYAEDKQAAGNTTLFKNFFV